VLAAAAVDTLFEPFHRAEKRDTTTGAGLGLAIARSITQAHDGTVTATANHTGGLTVTVHLPAAGYRS
jgi:two-component system sensor histidine kinase VanS